ncbi:MAG: ACP phosphodiesterase [Panacibacter sp.]
MNYLAHARLSFGNEQILVGNMISDFIKGKKKFDYPVMVQNGIMLHRMIDTFTDAHPVTKVAVHYLKPAAGPYASVFIDVVYDHFLATDKVEFPGKDLEIFATETYSTLDKNNVLLPERFSRMLPYMSEQNWLYNYQFEKGIENSFNNIFY